MHFLKDLIREIKLALTANSKREFLPRDQVSLYLSFTVHVTTQKSVNSRQFYP